MIFILVIGLIAVCYGFIEYSKIEIKTLYLADVIYNKQIPEAMKDKSILYVSDFQFDLPFGLFNHKAASKLVNTINKINPDLLVLGGDYIDGANYTKDTIFEYISQLQMTKIAILGNHDYKQNMKEKTVSLISKTGTILINESYDYLGVEFYGLDDYKGAPNLSPNLNSNKINIIISHRPDAFYDFKQDFDLMLSGHTHGGMITLFGLFAPIPHNGYGQKLVSGLVKEGSKSIYVSRGVGGNIFGLPIRIFSKPEVVLLKNKK